MLLRFLRRSPLSALARRWYAATFVRLPQTLILHQRRAWFLLRS